MEKVNSIGTDLFNKIRGRFSNVTIGDADGNLVDDPADARFFDFEYTSNGLNIGKVSVSVNDDDLTVIYSKDILSGDNNIFKSEWYEFLKELRKFAKRRLLQFDVRDIDKSNLTKRDYQHLAKTRGGEDGMNESKLYGTAHTSYQKVDGARIVIKHATPINVESASARTQHILNIYVESAEGERFKYPFKHLSGARAMARHVSEGGKLYDDFGSHIVGLSEEIYKLRKFKSYMNKSNVMAESLADYMDVVNGRLNEVKKTIEKLQKVAYYKETMEGFEKPILEDVPADVAESWIDQLTIKQFNEELKDVFPYIYRLVGEAKKVETVSLESIVDEVAGPKNCWDGYKKDGTQPGTGKNKGKRVNKCVPEELELEQAFEAMMGQFADAADLKKKVDEAYGENESRRPYVKFTQKKLPNGNITLQALANPAAYSPDAFSGKSVDTLRFTIVPPSANADGKIYHTLEQMMSILKRKNNTDGITVVLDKSLESISNQKKYNYLLDWLSSKPRSELGTVGDPSEAEDTTQDASAGEPIKKGTIIFVDVYFENNKETQTFDGSSLKVLEYLVDTKDKAYDGNPFVQGTPVSIVNRDTDKAGLKGTVVRSRVYVKEAEQFYANQKFKDLKAKIQEPYEKILITNTDAFFKLRKEYYDQIVSKYYKPTLAVFEVPPGDLEKFKNIVYSNEFEKEVGNPGLYFLSSVESPDKIPDAIVKNLPKRVQQLVRGNYKDVEYTDDNNAPAEPANTSGRLSMRSFKKLINFLDKSALLGNFKISREEFAQMETIDKPMIRTYMNELEQTKDIGNAKDIAAEIIMLQEIFPSVHKDRFNNIKDVLKRTSLDGIKQYMQQWLVQGLQLADKTAASTAVAGMPAKPAAAQQPPAEPEERKDPISRASLDKLRDLFNDRSVILDYYKEVANEILDKESTMIPQTLAQYKNTINRANSKTEVYNVFKNIDQRSQGNQVISKTLKPVSQDLSVVRKNPNVRQTFNKQGESIEEAKDYNFTPDDIGQLSQIRDLNAAKQKSLELITASSRRPMNKEKIGYFKNVIQSKRNVDDLIKMMYDMLLSGEGNAVIGTAKSTKPSRYRQAYGEETMESDLEEKINWKAIVTALGIGIAGLGLLKKTGAEKTPLGQSLQAAAEQGDQKAAQYLSQLNGLIDAGNNGAIQYIAKQYPPANEASSKKKKSKLKLTDFIMSHYDKETGQFPKGETAILTMVEKEYGEQYINPAKEFIKRINVLFDEYQMQNHPQQLEDTAGLDRIKSLAGL